MAEPIRVLLADDHALVRAGLRVLLTVEPDLSLVGEVATGDAARCLCAEVHPDILLLDLQMPGPPATETVIWLHAHCSATRVVILTAHQEDAWVRGLLDLGVAGYVLKDDALEAVVQAIRVAAAGGTWLSPTVLPTLLHPSVTSIPEALTPREREVLWHIAAGRSNKELGIALGVGVRTAEFHVKNILAKLGARSRAEVLPLAQRHRLLLPPLDANGDVPKDS